jgi:RNase P subunit RPR2
MKLFQENENSKAICENCQKIVVTKFKKMDIFFSDKKGFVKKILVSQCENCDSIVGIPSQSTPEIIKTRRAKTITN